MDNLLHKSINKMLRKNRSRSKVRGTSDRPRLTVTISNKNVSAQIINDELGKTIVSSTTVGLNNSGSLTDLAKIVGTDIAKKAIKADVKKVVFDKNGRKYAKRLSALADAARKEGLEF